MKKLIITSAFILLAVISFFVTDYFHQSDSKGSITISVVDEIGDTVSNETVTFEEGDTLLGILEAHHTVSCASNDYQPVSCDTDTFIGHVVLNIDSVQTNWNNAYIAIYVNGEYSTYGIDDIPLIDGNTYQFEYTVVGVD